MEHVLDEAQEGLERLVWLFEEVRHYMALEALVGGLRQGVQVVQHEGLEVDVQGHQQLEAK